MGETFLRRKGKLNNKGFSLLELLIVVAIMSIIAGVAMVGVSVIASADSKKMSKSLYSDINTLRTKTLSVEGNWSLKISKSDKNYKFELMKNGEVIQSNTGGRRVNLSFYTKFDSNNKRDTSDTSSIFTIDENNYVLITFRRDNGAFEKVEVYNKDGNLVYPLSDEQKKATKGEFVFTSGSHRGVYEVMMWYKTGRITTVN